MVKDVYDPLTEYVNVFRDRFKSIAQDTFAKLEAEAHVDVEANRETCRRIKAIEGEAKKAKGNIHEWKVYRIFAVVGAVGCIIAAFNKNLPTPLLAIAIVAVVAILGVVLKKMNERLEEMKAEHGRLSFEALQLKDEAWAQMEPLNRLYDWDMLPRMMTQTVPRLEFDPYFTTQRLADLHQTYQWDDSFNCDRSVLYAHSGQINGNPFVICRTRRMEMIDKTYYGYKEIEWTTREKGSDGEYHTVHHSEKLKASYTAPFPEYYEKTRLIYGNTAAPDLTFYREQSGLVDKIDSKEYKLVRNALRKKARDLSDSDYAMMTNEEFEVVFNTSNRNHNQQFALLFTPLAQETMMRLLADKEAGYGDDFDFFKAGMINLIIPNHIQTLELDMNPSQYRHYDFDQAKDNFIVLNARYFRAIYFALAPLLCVPMYQQIRPQSAIYGRDMQRHSAFWEHEALANFWGQDRFKHAECVTKCILKTEQSQANSDASTITVNAYGFRSEPRVEQVRKRGGDGCWHTIDVHWDEYFPVVGQGHIYMQEDNAPHDPSLSPCQRIDRINGILDRAHLDRYRRYIASRV